MLLATRPHTRLHWTCDSPSHYNDLLFCAINDAQFSDLLVHYRKPFVSSHPWKTPLRLGYRSRVRKSRFIIDWYLIRKTLCHRNDIFIFGGWSDPTSIIQVLLCVFLRRKYLFWTDTPNLDRKRHWLFKMMRRGFLRMAFSRAYAILGTGRAAQKALCKMKAPKEKIINFPYWVDVNSFQPPRLSVKPKSFLRFVSSGRVMNSKKGHDLAICSLARALEQVGNVDFEYIIAGTGPDVDELKSLADQVGIGQKVTFLGWVEPGDLVRVFHDSDILLHPSPTHEPYGVAVIEAMAAGLIVLASDTTGAALDRVKHGINGFIHKAANVEELTMQIVWLFKNVDKILAMKREVRKTAEQWPVSKGVKIIQQVLS